MRHLGRNRALPIPVRKQADIDECVLLRRIVQGDAAAFEVFYKHYYPKLFRFILRTTRQAELVEELIQETLLFVWENPERFNHESKISTWVFGIAYHKALKAMAKTARRSREMDVDELGEIIGDPLGNLAESAEIRNWLDCALDQLSVDQRAVIELTFRHGLAYQDIAKILDCPENTVKTRMFHARKKLRTFTEAQEN
jgi:RNA polymerase sigma factor (sigma-70 family)